MMKKIWLSASASAKGADRLLLAMVHGNSSYGLQKYEYFLGESLFYGVE